MVISVLAAVVFGYFVVSGLDRFLDANRRATKRNYEEKKPSRVVLTDDTPDEEILDEIHRFRDDHENACIILCDDADDISESDE